MTGRTSYFAGKAAEDCVARQYEAQGLRIRDRRWRGKGGEIDLILEDGAGLVFVEVKKSRSIHAALERLSQSQLERVCCAANEYVASEPGQLDTPMRVDLAVVGAHGDLEIIENITH